jgi:hypothetical protein
VTETPVAAPRPHPYRYRSTRVRIREDRQYNVGMAKLLMDRGYLNLAFSHLLYAEDLGEISLGIN